MFQQDNVAVKNLAADDGIANHTKRKSSRSITDAVERRVKR